jgi:hypothetical protein
MTSVWVVMICGFDGDELQGLYASMDAVRAAYPALVWEDISGEHGQEWKAVEKTEGRSWETEYRAELLKVIE